MHQQPQAIESRELFADMAMRRIFDDFMFALNTDERRFVVDMLLLLNEEAVHLREGLLSRRSSWQLRGYLQDEMSKSCQLETKQYRSATTIRHPATSIEHRYTATSPTALDWIEHLALQIRAGLP